MSRHGPKAGKRCKVCKAIHGPPFCTNPGDVATTGQMVAELVRVDAVLNAAGIDSSKCGGIAAAVKALVNERLQLQQLRMEIALAQPQQAAPQESSPSSSAAPAKEQP